MKKGLTIPSTSVEIDIESGHALNDFAFMAGLAYVKPGDSQYLLDKWLKSVGDGTVAVDNVEAVDAFKQSNPGYAQSPASYKLITFPGIPGFAIVSIRGTATVWDLMSDAQLWLAAILFQGLCELLPLGSFWTPILHKMVTFVSVLESDAITKVAFYRETSEFITYLKKKTNYTRIHVTGHSLGGGLALISGAQTKSPAVGLSAPNAMLSRDTFIPPLTPEELNTLTFNIVPKGDPIAMIDDLANLYQNIECGAEPNDLIGCHSSTRSLCEVLYTCGSSGRPVVCNCTFDYGYPAPVSPDPNANFTQACIDAAAEAAALPF